MENKKIDLEIKLHISEILIKLQRFEFLVHGLVSYFKEDILKENSSFKKLNAKVFLSTNPEDNKNRRQTLGQNFSIIKKHEKLIYNSELDELLEKRNIFIHNFWREYISNGKYDKQRCYVFLIKIESLVDDWTKVFDGFLSIIAKSIYNQQSEEFKMDSSRREKHIKYYENNQNEKHFYAKLILPKL